MKSKRILAGALAAVVLAWGGSAAAATRYYTNVPAGLYDGDYATGSTIATSIGSQYMAWNALQSQTGLVRIVYSVGYPQGSSSRLRVVVDARTAAGAATWVHLPGAWVTDAAGRSVWEVPVSVPVGYVSYAAVKIEGAYTTAGIFIGEIEYIETNVAPPSAPSVTVTDFTATQGTEDGEVNLAWSAPTGTYTGYRIWQDGALINTVGAAQTSATVAGLTVGRSYSFQVATYNGVGDGPKSSASITPIHHLQAPAVPSDLTVTNGSGEATVSWSPVGGADPASAYRVYVDGVQVAEQPGTAITLTGLNNGQTYTVQVRAINAAGYSSLATVLVRPVRPLAAPGKPVLAAEAFDGVVSLAWAAGGGDAAKEWRVYRNGSLVKITTGTEYADYEVVNGTEYTYTVAGTNDAGEGLPSDPVTVKPVKLDRWPGAPGAPVAEVTYYGLKAEVTLTSDLEGDVVAWRVYLDGQLVQVVTVPSKTALVTGLVPSTGYTVGVQAIDADGNESAVTEYTGQTAEASAVEKAVAEAQGAVGQMIQALGGGFKAVAVVAFGVIALVAAVMWLLRRGRKLASK